VKKIANDTKSKINDLNQELIPLKEERNQLNLQAKKCAEKRNKLNERIKNMRKDAKTFKEKRDAINKQVQELKNLRNEVSAKGKEKRGKISELQEKINNLKEDTPKGNLRQVSRRIQEIDWEIQTNSLPLKEEQQLINQVRELETQLVTQKRIKKVKDQLYELRSEQRSFGTEAKTFHEKLSDLAEESQKCHTQMIAIIETAKELQVEADDAHKEFVEARQKAQEKHEKCIELIKQIKEIQKDLKESADQKKAVRHDELKQELEERAVEKLKNGEKLLWEEFQILAEKGLL
jgi:uncharacterized coiled-coil DUF342 family protein